MSAKVDAWLNYVKKEHANIINNVKIWAHTIQVFLFPYWINEYFYTIGAVINLKENGKLLRENKLKVK